MHCSFKGLPIYSIKKCLWQMIMMMWWKLIGRFKNVFGKIIDNKIIGKINDKDNDEDDMKGANWLSQECDGKINGRLSEKSLPALKMSFH